MLRRDLLSWIFRSLTSVAAIAYRSSYIPESPLPCVESSTCSLLRAPGRQSDGFQACGVGVRRRICCSRDSTAPRYSSSKPETALAGPAKLAALNPRYFSTSRSNRPEIVHLLQGQAASPSLERWPRWSGGNSGRDTRTPDLTAARRDPAKMSERAVEAPIAELRSVAASEGHGEG
jgi:hypothetical protein